MTMGSPSSPSGIDTLITANENRAMFDRIAPHYDAANRVMSLGMDRLWRRRAVHALAPAGAGRYLDIGTGTGDVAFEILRQAPAARTVGVDPSARMLAVAARKAAAGGLGSRVAFEAGDALQLPFAAGAFDGVISAFCFRNIVNRRAALAEMCRVLRDGGRVVVLELTHPDRWYVRPFYRVYGAVIPLVGFCAGDAGAYRYLVQSIAEFPRPGEVAAMIGASGFDGVRHEPLCGGIVSVFSASKGETA